jgi:hypothetical protein
VTAVVTALDAGGATIIGPGQYTSGIDLETITPFTSTNDPVLTAQNAVPFVPGCTYPTTPGVTICHLIAVSTGPGQSFPLSYAGEFVPGTSIVLAAEAPGLTTQAVTIPIATPQPGASNCTGSPVVVCPGSIVFNSITSTPVPVTVSEPGVTTFQGSTASCTLDDVAFINNSQNVSGSSFVVEPGPGTGSCYLIFADQSGNQTQLQITNVNGQQATPTPTPSATATPFSTPTPVPPGPIAIAPSNTIEFASSTASPATFVASEAGVTSFSVNQSACAGIASVSPSSGTSFTVTPAAALTSGGSCTLTVSDPSGQFSYVGIYVDGLTIIINKR